jgi:ribosomal protein S18 acetylase RimI-like enzyme
MTQPPLSPDGKIESVVTYLEMFAPPSREPSPPPCPGLSLQRALRPTISFYRYLYDTIGEAWLWSDRKKLSDEALAAIIHHPDDEVHVLHLDGVPAGYIELDARDKPEIELAYLGIMPDFIGRKLGPYLLSQAIHMAFARGASRFWVHTCSLDHPSALPMYERAGFRIYKRETELADDPRALGLIRAGAPALSDRR